MPSSVLLQKVKSLIGSINLVGEEPKLKIQGFTRVPSFCSILLSAIAIVFINFISYLFLSESFNLSKPDVNIELRTLSNYPRVPLANENIYFAMMIRNFRVPTNTTISRMMTLRAVISIKSFTRDQNGVPINFEVKDYPLETVPCSQIQGDQYSYFSSSEISHALLEGGVCFLPKKGEIDNYYLQGHQIEDIYSELKVSLLPCSLEDSTQCLDSETMRSTEYMLVSPSPDVDLSKPDDFLNWIPLSSDVVPIDPGSHQHFNSKFKKFSIYDKTSMFREALHRKDYFRIDENYIYSFSRNRNKVHCPSSTIGNRALCQPYVEIKFTSSDKQETITRLYPSILRALSEIGGFTELIMMLIGFLYGMYNSWFDEMRSFLVQKVFARGEKTSSCSVKNKGFGKVVEDNLDIVEVMKELNGLRLLNRVIFKEHHLQLLPEVLSKIKDEECKEEQQKEITKVKEKAKIHDENRRLSSNKISPLKSKNNLFMMFTLWYLQKA